MSILVKAQSVLYILTFNMGFLFPLTSHADIEEILVTAQKRTEPLQSVPGAINALPGRLFNNLGINTTDDVEKIFPNMSSNNTSVINSGFAIRGVGTNNVHISSQQSIGTYIDDVLAVSPFVSAISVYDMDRVEVLRGPQNILYGRNTIGGVVAFHSRKARIEDGLNGRANLKAGNGGLLEFEGAVGFKLAKKMAVRIAIMSRSFDGMFKNIVDSKNVGGEEKKGIRFNLLWNISENSSVDFTYSKGKGNGDGLIARSVGNVNADGATDCDAFINGGENAFISGRNNCWTAITLKMINGNDYLASQLAAGNSDLLIANPNPATNTISPYLVNYSADWGYSYMDPSNFYDTEFDNFRLKFSHDFEFGQLTLLSAYDKTYALNSYSTDLAGFVPAQEGIFNIGQHEARLSSTGNSALHWMIGAYYSHHSSQEDTWVFRSDPDVAGGNGISPGIIIDSKYRNISIYGKIDYDLTDNLTASAGMQYTDDKLAGKTQKWVCLPGQHNGPTFDGTWTYDRDYRKENCLDISASLFDSNPTQELSQIGWKAGLTGHLNENVMIFGNISKGFKGGAYDNRALDNGSSPVDPEFLIAYEAGFKSDLFDDSLRLNVSAYLYDWKDLQIFGLDDNGGPIQVNIPKTKLKGVELELQWTPTTAIYLQAGLALSDSKIVDVTGLPASMGIVAGNSVTNAPKTSFNLLATYSFFLRGNELIIQGAYRYQGRSFFIAGSQDTARAVKNSHGWLDARISYNFDHDQQYSIAVWGNNLTEEKSCQYLPASLPGNVNWGCQTNDGGQRMWGLSADVKF